MFTTIDLLMFIDHLRKLFCLLDYENNERESWKREFDNLC